MPIDHCTVHVDEARFGETVNLYLEALKPLGYTKGPSFGPTVQGFANDNLKVPETDYKRADFWIVGIPNGPNHKTHLAFSANDRAGVDAFHAAATKAGAKDNGPPGIRSQYHPNYYGAFLYDLEGNNIEVVYHNTT